jgi:hypothetical protein
VPTDVERLIIEVPAGLHAKIKARAAIQRKSLKTYVVDAIDGFAAMATAELVTSPDRPALPGSWRQKRIVVVVPGAKAAELRAMAKPFRTFREFALRCIEVEIARARRRRAGST